MGWSPLHTPNPDAMLTVTQAARFLGVTPHTVGMWALRGWRRPNGTRGTITTGQGQRGRTYRLADLVDAERDTHLNPAGRPRTTTSRCAPV